MPKRLTFDRAKAVVDAVRAIHDGIDGELVSIRPRDYRLFDAIPVDAAKAYLFAHGWELVDEYDRDGSGLLLGLWNYKPDGDYRCRMAHTRKFDDCDSSVADMLNRCASLEGRSIWAVLADVFAPARDRAEPTHLQPGDGQNG